jgi:hypothetical protein
MQEIAAQKLHVGAGNAVDADKMDQVFKDGEGNLLIPVVKGFNKQEFGCCRQEVFV